MSIENLKKILESERELLSKQYRDEAFKANPNGYSVTPGCNEPDTDFELGHEAATNRLLPLLQKAVEMAEFYGDFETWNCGWDGKSLPEDKAREFLLSLSETTESVSEFTKLTEIKKEGE